MRCGERWNARWGSECLFQNGVVAVAEQALAHGFRILLGGEWSYLDVDELILWLAACRDSVAFALECGDQQIRVFLMRDGRDLHDAGLLDGLYRSRGLRGLNGTCQKVSCWYRVK